MGRIRGIEYPPPEKAIQAVVISWGGLGGTSTNRPVATKLHLPFCPKTFRKRSHQSGFSSKGVHMKNPENRKQSHVHDFPKIKSSKTKSGKNPCVASTSQLTETDN